MGLPERERIHHELLEALYDARKQVERLEAALAHNAAFLGTGVEREDQLGTPPPSAGTAGALARYIELVEQDEDISDYIGIEGHDESRPRLGPDAPPVLQPRADPPVSPLVGQLALAHPDDSISFTPQTKQNTVEPKDTLREAAKTHGPDILETVELDTFSDEFSGDPEPCLPGFAGAGCAVPTPDAIAVSPGQTGGEAQWPLVTRKQGGGPLLPGTVEPQGAEMVPSLEMPLLQYGEEDFLRAFLALQAINDGIWDWSVQTGDVYQSPRWQEILGCGHDNGKAPFDTLAACLHPVDADSLHTHFEELLAGKIARLRMSVRIKRPEDTWAWGMLRAVCLRSGNEPIRITAAMADITAQREAETALRASEEKFRALAEDSPDFIGRFDSHSLFLYASPNISRYLPVTPDQVIGKPLSAFDLSGEVAFFEETLNRVFEMGLPIQTEAHLVSPLVGAFVADCRFWPEFGVDGEVVSVTTQVRDMTFSRRMAENYQALFNSMVDGFALFEHISGWEKEFFAYEAGEFALIAMNPSLGRMLAVDASKSIGFRLSDLMGSDSAQWAACLRKVLIEERPILYSLRSAEKASLFEISAYSPEEGRIACIVKDVTELHMIEQEVRLNEARFAALYRLSHMDAAPEEEVVQFSLDQAVHLTGSALGYLYVAHGHDGEAGRVYWSREVLARFGDEPLPSDFCHTLWARTSHADCLDVRRAEVVNNVADTGECVANDSLAINRYMLAPVMEDDRIVCIAGVANKEQEYEASDLRQLELFINGMWFQLRRRWAVQTLQRAKDEAEAANRAKNEFLANVSHELRTPLNGILGMLQVLQQSALTAEQTECVVTANYSGRSLLRIISDILDFSRIEAGRFELTPQLFDFAATVRSTLGMFIHQAEQKKINFALRLSDNIPRTLVGDDARVRQIIFNLVGNAFKFIEKGEIAVECSMLPHRRNGKRCVYLAVSDTGIGIPEDKLGDIFRAFTQLDGSSTRRYAGTGLGLAIVQRLVLLMEGTLTVESTLGEGTTVHCSLPFDEADTPLPLESEGAVPYVEAPPLDILVVEDDPVNQMTLRSLLTKAGHSSVCVNDGRQALEALMLHSFECLVTDIQMPVMDGVELVSRIRAGNTADIEPSETVCELLGLDVSTAILQPIPPDIPIVALTAHAMTGDRERFLGMGMDHYLAKPILATELFSVLNHVSTLLHARRGR